MVPKEEEEDHYAVLGVSPDAPGDVVRAAYRALVAKCHPDRNPDNRDAEAKLKRLNAAFQVVGNPEKRSQYDASRRGPIVVESGPTPESYGAESHRSEGFPTEADAREAAAWKVVDREPPVEEAPVREKGGVGRALGWIFGLAAISGVLAAWQSASETKPRDLPSIAAAPPPQARAAAPAEPSASASWVWSTEPDLRASFPATPEPGEQNVVITKGESHETLTTLSRPSGAVYAVERTEYPSGARLTEQSAVDGALKEAGAQTHQALTLVWDRRASIGNCNGRDVSAVAKTFAFRWLVCVRGSRSYTAMAVTPLAASAGEAAEASSFLTSFAVTSTAN